MKDMPEEDCRKLLINFQEEKETYEIKAKVISCFSSSIFDFFGRCRKILYPFS